MTTALLIIIAVLLLALWISAMALWWHHEQGLETDALQPRDVISVWNKAARLARRSWYGTLRYGKQATLWGNKKASMAFIAIFPKSRAAFTPQNELIGLEHGPSSYFLASLSKIRIHHTKRAPKVVPDVSTVVAALPASGKPTTRRRKKILEIEPISDDTDHLSV